MNKFKVGDTIRRTTPCPISEQVKQGAQYVVARVSGAWLGLKGSTTGSGDPHPFHYKEFELVQSVHDVNTAQENLAKVLRGTPLQVQVRDKWRDILDTDYLTVAALREETFREKPTETVMNGMTVPLPDTDYGTQYEVYVPDLMTCTVITVPTNQGYIRGKTRYWNKREDAERVLKAMLQPFNI